MATGAANSIGLDAEVAMADEMAAKKNAIIIPVNQPSEVDWIMNCHISAKLF